MNNLFTSKPKSTQKQLKSPKGKKLVISPPVRNSASLTSPLGSPGRRPELSRSTTASVILKTKYEFVAQAPPELSAKKHSYLTLLNRPGNGWLQVQSVESKAVGIVPASYVTIVVNDSAVPITTEWLNDYEAQTPTQENIAAVGVLNVLKSPFDEVWYQVKVTTESGRRSYCAKFYGDFVDLHQRMLGQFGPFKVPYLPRLRTEDGAREASNAREVAMVDNLDRYMKSMLQFSEKHANDFFRDFLTTQATRKVEFSADDLVPGDAAVAQALYKGSAVLVDGSSPLKDRCYSTTAPLPPVAKFPQSPTATDVSSYSDSNVKYSSYLNRSSAGRSQSTVNLSEVRGPREKERELRRSPKLATPELQAPAEIEDRDAAGDSPAAYTTEATPVRSSTDFSINSLLDNYDTSGSELDSPQKSLMSGYSARQSRSFPGKSPYKSVEFSFGMDSRKAFMMAHEALSAEPIKGKKALFRSWSSKEVA